MQLDSDALKQAWMEGRDVLWYKGINGIGDRLHHIAQLIRTAEKFEVLFLIDMRDGMLAENGEDAFLKYFTCEHPLFVGGLPWFDLESDELRVEYPNLPEFFVPLISARFPSRRHHHFNIYLLSEGLISPGGG